jgi:hypothetical protein
MRFLGGGRMSIEDYVQHLGRDEVKIYAPLKEDFYEYLVEPTQEKYKELLKRFIRAKGQYMEFLPDICIFDWQAFYRFVAEIMKRLY